MNLPNITRSESLRRDREALISGASALRYRAERLQNLAPDERELIERWQHEANRLERMAARER